MEELRGKRIRGGRGAGGAGRGGGEAPAAAAGARGAHLSIGAGGEGPGDGADGRVLVRRLVAHRHVRRVQEHRPGAGAAGGSAGGGGAGWGGRGRDPLRGASGAHCRARTREAVCFWACCSPSVCWWVGVGVCGGGGGWGLWEEVPQLLGRRAVHVGEVEGLQIGGSHRVDM